MVEFPIVTSLVGTGDAARDVTPAATEPAPGERFPQVLQQTLRKTAPPQDPRTVAGNPPKQQPSGLSSKSDQRHVDPGSEGTTRPSDGQDSVEAPPSEQRSDPTPQPAGTIRQPGPVAELPAVPQRAAVPGPLPTTAAGSSPTMQGGPSDQAGLARRVMDHGKAMPSLPTLAKPEAAPVEPLNGEAPRRVVERQPGSVRVTAPSPSEPMTTGRLGLPDTMRSETTSKPTPATQPPSETVPATRTVQSPMPPSGLAQAAPSFGAQTLRDGSRVPLPASPPDNAGQSLRTANGQPSQQQVSGLTTPGSLEASLRTANDNVPGPEPRTPSGSTPEPQPTVSRTLPEQRMAIGNLNQRGEAQPAEPGSAPARSLSDHTPQHSRREVGTPTQPETTVRNQTLIQSDLSSPQRDGVRVAETRNVEPGHTPRQTTEGTRVASMGEKPVETKPHPATSGAPAASGASVSKPSLRASDGNESDKSPRSQPTPSHQPGQFSESAQIHDTHQRRTAVAADAVPGRVTSQPPDRSRIAGDRSDLQDETLRVTLNRQPEPPSTDLRATREVPMAPTDQRVRPAVGVSREVGVEAAGVRRELGADRRAGRRRERDAFSEAVRREPARWVAQRVLDTPKLERILGRSAPALDGALERQREPVAPTRQPVRPPSEDANPTQPTESRAVASRVAVANGSPGQDVARPAPTKSVDAGSAKPAAGDAAMGTAQSASAVRGGAATVVSETTQAANFRAMVESIVARARTTPQRGTVELRFALQPEHLGTVLVRLEAQGQQLRLRLIASTQAAVEALNGGLSRLGIQLTEAGFPDSQIDLEYRGTSQESQEHRERPNHREREARSETSQYADAARQSASGSDDSERRARERSPNNARLNRVA